MSGELSCPLCSTRLPEKELESHLREDLDYTPWTCRLCGVGFFSRSDATNHFLGPLPAHSTPEPQLSEKLRLHLDAKVLRLLRLVRGEPHPKAKQEPPSSRGKDEHQNPDSSASWRLEEPQPDFCLPDSSEVSLHVEPKLENNPGWLLASTPSTLCLDETTTEEPTDCWETEASFTIVAIWTFIPARDSEDGEKDEKKGQARRTSRSEISPRYLRLLRK